MPTQATSNQMFGRVASYLTARYPHQSINLQLIHAQATHHPLYKTLQAQDDRERQGNEDRLVAEAWFQHRKRTLLSSMAVGTIDQAMLGVTNAPSLCAAVALSHKVVVFDEIHAYDTYISSIINRLCQWLRAMHSPTIMLSATLPQQVKRDLFESFGQARMDCPRSCHAHAACVRAGVVEVLPVATAHRNAPYSDSICGSFLK
jgi:CRISPR-associated endonuclease/helicase Cas3